MREGNGILKNETLKRYADTIVGRVKTERMPIFIAEVIIFGSYLKGKTKPHDLDVLLVIDSTKEGEDYRQAREAFKKLIKFDELPSDLQYNYHLDAITHRLIRGGMKKIDVKIANRLQDFIRSFWDKDGTLKETGLLLHVVWSSSWEKELLREKQHPMLPYLRFLRIVNRQEIRELNLNLDEIENRLRFDVNGDER